MPAKKKQKSVASVSATGNMVIGASDVMRWDDVMTIQGHDVKISKAVELGLSIGEANSERLKKDLKSKTGLLVTFPMMYLMSHLQEHLEKVEKIPHSRAGEELLKRVAP